MIEWTERYNYCTARVGKVGDLNVSWCSDTEGSGYKVTVFGTRLKNLSTDYDEARRRAVGFAKKLLAEASAGLSD